MVSNFKKTLKNQSPISLALGISSLLIPVVALYATKGIVVLFSFVVLVCLFVFITKQGTRPVFPKLFSLSVLALTGWAFASLIWTVSSDLSWNVSRSMPISMLGGLLILASLKTLDTTDQVFVTQSLIGGFLIGLSLTIFDITTDFTASKIVNIFKTDNTWSLISHIDMRSFVINNGVSILTMLLWPTMIVLSIQNRYKLALFGFFTTLFIIFSSVNFAAAVAIGVGSLSFLVAFFAPSIFYKITTIGITILILGTPFVMTILPDARTVGKNLPELSYSVYPRLVIWQYASNLIIKKPLVGHGIRTSRSLSTNETKITFLYRDNGEIHTGNTEKIPLHPHNGIIQIWLELGFGGAILGLMLILCSLKGIKSCIAPKMSKALAYAALTSSVCLISVSYGLWQSWWLASLWLQGSLVTVSLIPRDDFHSSSLQT